MDNENRTGASGWNLRELRRAAGFSQQRVAELAECSINMVGLFERGYAPASSQVLGRVTAVLNAEGRPAGNGTPFAEGSAGGDGRRVEP